MRFNFLAFCLLDAEDKEALIVRLKLPTRPSRKFARSGVKGG